MYTVEKVVDETQSKAFIEMPVKLYQGNPYWIRPLDKDIRNVFDEVKNPCFKHGECERWLLKNENGEYVGRVAAFINGESAYIEKYKVGQMGFFECINNQEAAFMLFDTCKEWLEERGMEIMEGPVNFGERIEWWGLLVEGFDKEPIYAMPYTNDYYVALFEAYGFRDYFKQFTYQTRLVVESLSPVVVWKADRLLKNPDYKVSTYREIGKKKAIDSLIEIYNKAWNLQVHGVGGITREQVETIYKNLKPIIDKDLIYFAYYKNQAIGFYLMFPEVNHVVKHLNGKMDWWEQLKFFYLLRIKKVDMVLGQLFGVVPDFQNKGVEAAMIKEFCDKIIKSNSHYKTLQMNWIGDFNPKMLHLMDYLGAHVVKTHVTYRKLFREDMEFYRSADKLNEGSKEEKKQA